MTYARQINLLFITINKTKTSYQKKNRQTSHLTIEKLVTLIYNIFLSLFSCPKSILQKISVFSYIKGARLLTHINNLFYKNEINATTPSYISRLLLADQTIDTYSQSYLQSEIEISVPHLCRNRLIRFLFRNK